MIPAWLPVQAWTARAGAISRCERRSQTRRQLGAHGGEHLGRRRCQVVAVQNAQIGAPCLLTQDDALLDQATQGD
jgi:hypothetical protein